MSNFHFSNRTEWSLHNNPLTFALEELRKHDVPIIDLTQSNPTACGFHYPSAWLGALSDENNLKYSPQAQGMSLAREGIADYYRRKGINNVAPGRMVLTSSTSEGYSFLLKLLANPGDHVLIPKPSYPLFQFLLELHDVRYDFYPLVYNDGWAIDRECFKSLITPKTKAVILVNPNNPTGSYLSEGDKAFLNEHCCKHHMAIISDEVFFDYKLKPEIDPRSLLMAQGPHHEVLSFTLSGVSKILGLPQMKLSWIVVNGPQADVSGALERLEIIADTYLSVNTPVQNALGAWLRDCDYIQKQILERVGQNLKFLREGGLKVLDVQGGWYGIVRISSKASEESFILDLLKNHHVLVHPGYFFDFDYEGHVVVSLLPQYQEFQKGIEKMKFVV